MTDANFLNETIYADNAATTQIDEDALNLMFKLQKNFFANPSSSYKIARPVKKILSDARERIAACINAEPNEIYFTSGGTESNNWAIKTNVPRFSRIITSNIEHSSVLNTCRAMKNIEWCPVTKIKVDESGLVNPELLRKRLCRKVSLVSIMLASNEVGTIQPIRELAALAHEKEKIFHTDAVQAVGHIPIDVKNLGVDMLSASAHKFNGPKGIGFLYVRRKTNVGVLIDGGGQEKNMRAGTENVAAIAAMALALEKNCAEMETNAAKVSECAKFLVNYLRKKRVDFILNGGENRLPGHLSLSFRNFSGEALLHQLDLQNIFVSTGSACKVNRTKISHVLQALNIPEDYIRGTIRVTFGKNNSLEDAKKIAEQLWRILDTIKFQPPPLKMGRLTL